MNRLFAVIHPNLNGSADILESQLKCCRRYGISVSVEEEERRKYSGLSFDGYEAAQCDAIMAVGGDGTFLQANAIAYQHQLPVFGVNRGHLGFLADVEPDSFENAMTAIQEDRFFIEERMMLQITVMGKHYYALNDAVLSRGAYSRLLNFKTAVDQKTVGSYRADGIIISTPTGSTAYSLSAGGPIVCPDVECMVITPVCPHTLQQRPIVARAESVISVTPKESGFAVLSVDGHECVRLTDDAVITATKAQRSTRFVHVEQKNYFEKIRYKLSEWSAAEEE